MDMTKLMSSITSLSKGQYKNFVKLLILALVGYYAKKFYSYLKWRNQLLKMYKVPPSSVFLGNLMDFVNAGGFNEKFFQGLHAKYGDIAGFFLLPTLFNLSTSNADYINELYKKTRSRPYETYMFLFYLGTDNLMFSHGPIVKQLRLKYGSMISNKQQLEKLHEFAKTDFETLFDTWSKQKQVNIFPEIGPVIYDVMGKVLFGGGWTKSDIGQAIYTQHKYLITNVNSFMILPWLKPFGYIKYKQVMKKWRSLCNELLDERERQIAENPKQWEGDESALTMLLTSKDDKGAPFFTRHRAISTVCGFLNGAYDTTHATCFWLVYNLAHNPEKQDKLREEIKKHVFKNNAPIKSGDSSLNDFSIDDARNCEYLDCFIKESMRLYSTVPVNQRVNYDEDIELGGGKVLIPKGTNVNVPNSVIFMKNEYFGPNTEVFRPERFMEGDEFAEIAKRSWTAFGNFNRMCIGATFAFVELKVFLIVLVSKYIVKVADESDCNTPKMIEAGVNQPENKIPFKFVPV